MQVLKGQVNVLNIGGNRLLGIFVIRRMTAGVVTCGEATLQFSTNDVLLARANEDIKTAFPTVCAQPTHLILFNNNDIRVSTSIEVFIRYIL